ncbi:MAG: DEAD/DEAH box helicase [Planctomycetia bacterium]|nr:DEAD/DEAH box helicase [Planctomycetia bacterium]
MSRSRFNTGEPYQGKVAVWVRRRLVDQRGILRNGRRRIDQRGVVLADGVGLGKTWEALAASALLLTERSKRTKSGEKRRNQRQRAAKVLVLCPPGLVSKWTREIRDPDGFGKRLAAWTRSQPHRRRFVRATLTQPYEIRSTRDLQELPPPRRRGKQAHLGAGTYVCNWNVVVRQAGPGRSRLAALQSQRWDVLIVDEAHHREARKALDAILGRTDIGAVILLTATPFQLDPKELHPLLGMIVDRKHSDHKFLSRPPVSRFVRSMDRFFQGGDPPTKAEKNEAEGHICQIIARNQLRTTVRRHFVIDKSGRAHKLHPPPERVSERELAAVIPHLIDPGLAFESWYFQRRLALAAAEGVDRTFVATKLRQALSTKGQASDERLNSGKGPPYSPRTDALLTWASQQIEDDLRSFQDDGQPRKLLVFTSFVRHAAADLVRGLEQAATQAWQAVRKCRQWRKMAIQASRNLDAVECRLQKRVADCAFADAPPRAQEIVHQLVRLPAHLKSQCGRRLTADLCGHKRFCNLLSEDLLRQLNTIQAVVDAERCERWQKRLHREEIKRLGATLSALHSLRVVATYTGHDDRHEREASGEAFRSPHGPWVLVASNVGSEGIDLQTYSKHLVHFDIEWNPARMEQREGRVDRVGRQLAGHVNVYYLLVQKTYDERMLHQLVARQRWHSVLLGRPAARLAKDQPDETDPRLIEVADSRKWTLDLRPGG